MSDGTRHVAEAEIVADLARSEGFPREVKTDVPTVLVIPAEAQVVQPDVREWRSQPFRPTGTYRPATVASLIAIAKGCESDATTIWVHPTSGRVVAVFDDYDAEIGPGWREHRAQLDLQPTPEWLYWNGKDNAMLNQDEFALHIEGGLQEIEQPDGATMLEIAQSFHATNGVSFRSATRLASGEQQFLYDETIEAKAGRSGELSVPTTFVLLLAPFVGEEERQVVARLRYRISNGGLSLGYRLERPDRVVREALDAVAEQLAGEFPRVFVGEPA